MSIELHQREAEGIVILDVEGRLVLGDGVSALRDRFNNLGGENKFILNLKDVPYIDSSGLGALVTCHSVVEAAGGALRLLHLSKRNMELLVLTKLSTVFRIFDDEQEAVNSFFPDREIKRFDILDFVKSQEEGEKPV
ncbi:MAG TPA: STAS domain-containing protein [Bryobacteraceae bacterium]|jgi:anti-sigma B factor antagonist